MSSYDAESMFNDLASVDSGFTGIATISGQPKKAVKKWDKETGQQMDLKDLPDHKEPDLASTVFVARDVLEDAITETKTSLDERMQELEWLAERTVELERNLALKDEETKIKTRQINDLNGDLQSLQAKYKQSQQREKEGFAKIKELEHELQLEQERTEKAREAAGAQIDSLKKEMASMKTELDETRLDRSKLVRELDQTRGEMDRNEGDRNKKMAELRRMKEESSRAKAELKVTKTKEKDALNRIADLEQDLEVERNKAKEKEAIMQREVVYMEKKLHNLMDQLNTVKLLKQETGSPILPRNGEKINKKLESIKFPESPMGSPRVKRGANLLPDYKSNIALVPTTPAEKQAARLREEEIVLSKERKILDVEKLKYKEGEKPMDVRTFDRRYAEPDKITPRNERTETHDTTSEFAGLSLRS